jgi:hypothetical protein
MESVTKMAHHPLRVIALATRAFFKAQLIA